MITSFKPLVGRKDKTKARSLILASVLSAALHSASAATTYSTGFENPPFAGGSELVGQDGWTGVPFLSPDAAIISTAAALTGLQGVQVRGADMVNAPEVDPLAAVGSYRKPLNYDTAAPGGLPLVTVQANVRLNGPVIGTGDFFSANIAARSPDADVELSISSDGIVYGYSPAGPAVYSAPISLNAWHTLGITWDFAANTYMFSVDGTLSGVFAFDAGITSDVLLRESLVTYANPDAGSNLRSNFTAYFDNVSATAVVPEPASASLLAFGCVALMNFRRRQNHR
jgi:hypothetical protein